MIYDILHQLDQSGEHLKVYSELLLNLTNAQASIFQVLMFYWQKMLFVNISDLPYSLAESFNIYTYYFLFCIL